MCRKDLFTLLADFSFVYRDLAIIEKNLAAARAATAVGQNSTARLSILAFGLNIASTAHIANRELNRSIQNPKPKIKH